MERVREFLPILDYSLDTKKKRHLISGILMSAAMLFVGLAITIMTLKEDSEDE